MAVQNDSSKQQLTYDSRYKAQWLGCMRFLIVVGLACSSSYGPTLLLKLGHPAFSKRSTLATSTYTSDKRYHVLVGLAGSCSPLSVSDCHCLCQELPLQQQPSALLGFVPSCARADLQHTILSLDSTIESCRYCTLVFIDKQTLGMAKSISSKHTLLERDVLEITFSVHDFKSGWRKSLQKTGGQKGEKGTLRKWCVKTSPKC